MLLCDLTNNKLIKFPSREGTQSNVYIKFLQIFAKTQVFFVDVMNKVY